MARKKQKKRKKILKNQSTSDDKSQKVETTSEPKPRTPKELKVIKFNLWSTSRIWMYYIRKLLIIKKW